MKKSKEGLILFFYKRINLPLVLIGIVFFGFFISFKIENINALTCDTASECGFDVCVASGWTCDSGTYDYNLWSDCSGGYQTRTAVCNGSCTGIGQKAVPTCSESHQCLFVNEGCSVGFAGGGTNCAFAETRECGGGGSAPPGQCATNADCNDNNACTTDTCSGSVCYHDTVAGTHNECSGPSCVATANTPTSCSNTCTGNNSCIVTVPPYIAWDFPGDGSIVSGKTVRVSGWSMDSNNNSVESLISKFEIFVDGILISSSDPASPKYLSGLYGGNRPDICAFYWWATGCSLSPQNVPFGFWLDWDSTTVKSGSHTMTVKSTDSDTPPKTTSIDRVINVNNPQPTCGDYTYSPVNWTTHNTSGNLYVYAYHIKDASMVYFPTYIPSITPRTLGPTGWSDSLVWYPGVKTGDGNDTIGYTWKGTINLAEHFRDNPFYGQFATGIYLAEYGVPGTSAVGCLTFNWNRTPMPAPTVNLQITDQWAYPVFTPNNIFTLWWKDNVLLKWDSTDATSCTMTDNGVPVLFAVGTSNPSQTVATINNLSHTYALTCTGPTGLTTTKQISVTVPPPPTSVTGSCTPDGRTINLSWIVPPGYTTSYVRLKDMTIPKDVYFSGPDYSGNTFSTASLPGHKYSYWIHTSKLGDAQWPYSIDTPTANVERFTCSDPMPPAPNLKITVWASWIPDGRSSVWIYNQVDGPIEVYNGAPYALTWGAVPDATSCTLDGVAVSTAGGNINTYNASLAKTHTLTCTGPGGTVSDTVSYTIPPKPLTFTKSCNAGGTQVVLNWTLPISPIVYTDAYIRGDLIIDVFNSLTTTATINPSQIYNVTIQTRNQNNGAWSDILSPGLSFSCPNTLLPDLTAGNPPQSSATEGTPIQFTSVISNNGSASTGASFSNFFQVKDSLGNISPIAQTAIMSALASGANGTATSLNYNFASAGTFYVRACADKSSAGDPGVIPESDEGNNCSGWTPINVSAVALVNNATCTSITAPDNVSAGSTFSATVIMLNSGTQTWQSVVLDSNFPYRLGSQNTQDNTRWGFGRVELPVTSVAPGSSATFTFNATAPVTPGTYPFDWQMVREGKQWIPVPGSPESAICRKNIIVGPAPASFTFEANPPSVVSGGVTTLKWTTLGATACTATGGTGADGWNPPSAKNSADGAYTQNVTVFIPTSYTLDCRNATPGDGPKTLWVNIITPSSITITPSYGGYVTSDVGGLNCGTTCFKSYTEGTSVKLTANPSSIKWKFIGWRGDCAGQPQICSLTVTGSKNTTAIFAPRPIYTEF